MSSYEKVTILGIESSCDETSAAVIVNGKVLANCIANQNIHIKYGGVVPELAGREHQKNIVPVVDTALKQAGVSKSEINAVAFTKGPGLIGSLLVGTSFAKGFSFSLNVPLIEVNNMQAHILAHFIDHTPPFPFLCLTVSGGHTQIVKVKSHFKMEILGETLDDAAGEAFDKIAKIIGLPYPGGPLIDKHASTGNPSKFKFSEPSVKGYDYSFSGLKTSVLYFLKDQIKADPDFITKNLNDICASVQHTIISILLKKLIKASQDENIHHVAVAGGVSANSELRAALIKNATNYKWTTYIPKFEYCTDNAAMIAMAGYFKYLNREFSSLENTPDARLKF